MKDRQGIGIVTKTIGIVKEGKFFPVDKEKKEEPIEVTEIAMMQARGPIPSNLEEYEGKMIMIAGNVTEKTIYKAKVVDVASPILTEVVLSLARQKKM
jgi:hypothetical protein